jgi:hypothetical protein
MRLQTTRRTLIPAVCVVLFFSLTTVGCDVNPPVTEDRAARAMPHGVTVTALDVAGSSALTVEEAIGLTGMSISLPDPALVGEPVKVALNETVEDGQGRMGLLIRYSSGVTLSIEPGETAPERLLGRPSGSLPFTDGRTSTFQPETLADRKVLARLPGIQYSDAGESGVPAMLLWSLDGATYRLVDGPPAITAAAAAAQRGDENDRAGGPSVAKLRLIAASVRTAD